MASAMGCGSEEIAWPTAWVDMLPLERMFPNVASAFCSRTPTLRQSSLATIKQSLSLPETRGNSTTLRSTPKHRQKESVGYRERVYIAAKEQRSRRVSPAGTAPGISVGRTSMHLA